jgi:hypothetical protein
VSQTRVEDPRRRRRGVAGHRPRSRHVVAVTPPVFVASAASDEITCVDLHALEVRERLGHRDLSRNDRQRRAGALERRAYSVARPHDAAVLHSGEFIATRSSSRRPLQRRGLAQREVVGPPISTSMAF